MNSKLFTLLIVFTLGLISFSTKSAYAVFDCGKNSICSLQPLPAGAHPGTQCADSSNYVYGTTSACGPGQSTPCIPRCGIGDAWCCDPKQGYTPASAIPQGCSKLGSNGGCSTVPTAIGDISTDPSGFVNSLFRILLSLSGGVAVLLIIAAGYQLMTSQGNPEKVKEARERLTSAIIGLVFILFSVTILQIIGVDILHIPGFK